MSDDAINQELTEDIRQRLPFAAELGLEVLESTPERVRVRTGWKPERCTSFGILHGGFLMAVADTAGAMLASNNLPEGKGTTTLESKTNFLGAVREGQIIATSEAVHVGRTSIVVTTDIRDERGKLIVRTMQTQLVLDAR